MRAPFVFRSEWHVDASAQQLFDVLADLEGYCDWWPQVRGVRRVAEGAVGLDIRSLLPVGLELRARFDERDREAGVLAGRLDGDLVGHVRWTVRDGLARWDQECVVAKEPMASLPEVARPVARGNHAWMMRGGERGLRRHLLQRAAVASPGGVAGATGGPDLR